MWHLYSNFLTNKICKYVNIRRSAFLYKLLMCTIGVIYGPPFINKLRSRISSLEADHGRIDDHSRASTYLGAWFLVDLIGLNDWSPEEDPRCSGYEVSWLELFDFPCMVGRVRRDSRLGLDFSYFSGQISRLGLVSVSKNHSTEVSVLSRSRKIIS